jgi:threonine/homoserine/homoserine lactone efflux protein
MDLWEGFLITFIVGLSGAMSPGALLSYTIYQSVENSDKSFKIGLFISIGHALAELIPIAFILIGLGYIFQNSLISLCIGVVGALILIYIGCTLTINVIRNKINTEFLNKNYQKGSPTIETGEATEKSRENQTSGITIKKSHPIVTPMLFLASNPHWYVWWATVGVSLMLSQNISIQTPLRLGVFFLAKEISAFLWYTGIAVLLGLSTSKKLFSPKIYLGLLLLSALFMVVYGTYLGITSILTYI